MIVTINKKANACSPPPETVGTQAKARRLGHSLADSDYTRVASAASSANYGPSKVLHSMLGGIVGIFLLAASSLLSAQVQTIDKVAAIVDDDLVECMHNHIVDRLSRKGRYFCPPFVNSLGELARLAST